MLLWSKGLMSTPFTARIRSPKCSLPHRSAGLPSIIRPKGKKNDGKGKSAKTK